MKSQKPRLFSKKFLILILLLSIAMPFVLAGWKDLWLTFLENGRPEILILESPRGVGLAPTVMGLTVSDEGAGLDEIVVRARQRNRKKELFRQKYKRDAHATVSIPISKEDGFFLEGDAEIEIKAFDKSFWSNTAITTIPLKVDFKKPTVKVLSSQHNIRQGGSQLVLYKAEDAQLNFHGVKVGSETFLGFPARGLDANLKDQDIFAAFFSVPLSQEQSPTIKVFAEDEVGNGTSTAFYHKILPTPIRPERIRLTDSFLNESVLGVYRANLEGMQKWAAEIGETIPQPLPAEELSPTKLLDVFKFLNNNLRNWSNLELKRLMAKQRSNRLWEGAFIPAKGTIRSAYGRKVFFDYQNETVDSIIQNAYEILSNGSVEACNNGIIAAITDVGIYGKTIVIDHGLGLFSTYSWLGESTVRLGQEVRAGELIARIGKSGMYRDGSYLFQLRLSGIAVDPREWWDKSWYYAHVIDKVNDVKRALGYQNIRNSL